MYTVTFRLCRQDGWLGTCTAAGCVVPGYKIPISRGTGIYNTSQFKKKTFTPQHKFRRNKFSEKFQQISEFFFFYLTTPRQHFEIFILFCFKGKCVQPNNCHKKTKQSKAEVIVSIQPESQESQILSQIFLPDIFYVFYFQKE